jgi:putative redox protein
MYAARAGLALEHVIVRLKHQKRHAEDCADCETKQGKIDFIERSIELIGPDLDAVARNELLQIADKCPVHRTLQSEIRIETRLEP